MFVKLEVERLVDLIRLAENKFLYIRVKVFSQLEDEYGHLEKIDGYYMEGDTIVLTTKR